MSERETCEYTHDVSGARFDDLDTDIWRCPHPVDDPETKYCPFHQPAGAVSADTLAFLLRNRVEAQGGLPSRFIGARIGTLDLDYAVLVGESNHPIDLRETTVTGAFRCRNASISQALLLAGAEIEGPLSAQAATFEGRVLLRDAHLEGEMDFEEAIFRRRFDVGDATLAGFANFRLATFESWTDMRRARFLSGSHFRNARFAKGVYAVETTFESAPDFLNATFEKVGNFKRARFERGANFGVADCLTSLDFRDASLRGPVDFQASMATGEVSQKRRAFDGVGWFEGVNVAEDLRFDGTVVGGDLQLVDAEVGASLTFDPPADVTEDVHIDLREATVGGGRLAQPANGWTYDLERATIGDVTLDTPAGTDLFATVRIRETTFDGFDFGASTHREALARHDWQLHRDLGVADLESTYLKAKNGAAQVGASKAAAEFFRKEMTARRAGHLARCRDESLAPFDRMHAGIRWLANGLIATTAGYGERPSYVVAWSLGVIALFAGFYAAVLGLPSIASIGAYLLFSFQSFITFIIGSPPAPSSLLSLRIVSAVEGFVGAFFIALFVFTLTRSVHR